MRDVVSVQTLIKRQDISRKDKVVRLSAENTQREEG